MQAAIKNYFFNRIQYKLKYVLKDLFFYKYNTCSYYLLLLSLGIILTLIHLSITKIFDSDIMF